MSTGGIVTTEEFVRYLNLRKGQKVLDVGCGIGGGDFYMVSVIERLTLPCSWNCFWEGY